ncbi:MAG: cysteine--tRNA ligase [Mollicutes bacterium]|nr:cysteine--tRNA ligase [Mollicutes bacterium]MDD7264081.1 cysteine--tRNA ligase [bacterium]MDY4978980.1 cysteine--tRNA ligase [Candidatus Onthovivens sp.]
MEIKFYNSLTKKIETFKPIKENEISIYVCGPTVYNEPHIGNMRPVIFFDTIRKFFETVGYKVTYVSNFTDVDDKIITKAINEGVDEKTISTRYINAYLDCLNKLNVEPASLNPKATEYIPSMIDYIQNLINKGYAYIEDGEVFFDVSKISDYGCLSNIDKESLRTNARIAENVKKHSQYDFLLWKKTTEGIKWNTPFCDGRPGWHTECCVMIDTIFKGPIDIHGGGSDLKFPHHENEIAQAEATHNNHLANYWFHTAMMNINGEKMSKSLGNVILTKDAIKEYGADTVRLVLLNNQYRQSINFTDKTVSDNQLILSKISNCIKQMSLKMQINNLDLQGNSKKIEPFLNFLANDFNLPNAITYTLDLVKGGNQIIRNKELNLDELKEVFYALMKIIYILGLSIKPTILDKEDKELLSNYEEAKKEKNFAESDRIRKILIDKNIL